MSATVLDAQRDTFRDDVVDARRYLSALRRRAGLVAAIVLLGTVSTLAVSLAAPSTYDASAEIIVFTGDAGLSEDSDGESLRRQLATLQALVVTPTVLQPAAAQLGTDLEDLRGRVSTFADGTTNLLTVAASGTTAEGARDAANTVAQAFVDERRRAESARLDAAIDGLRTRAAELQGGGASADGLEIQALEERLAELVAVAATPGANLQIVQEAQLPTSPSGPDTVRNTVIAFLGSLIVALFLVIAWEQLGSR